MTDAIKTQLIGFIAAMIVLGLWYAITVFIMRETKQIEANRINIEELKEEAHEHAKD